jgi:uncharacterized protein DUF1559
MLQCKPVNRRHGQLGLWLGMVVCVLAVGGVAIWFFFVRKDEGSFDPKRKGGWVSPAEVSQASNNFHQVTLAMIDHADLNDSKLPTQAIHDPLTGKPLLSWRVAILPELEQEALYRQIRLNEPWDSPHNKQFWSKMPKCYELPGLPASEGMTAVQVFVGPETPFRGNIPTRFPAGIPDGPSLTIAVVEAEVPVNWMEPRDLEPVDLSLAMSMLGNRTNRGPLVGLFDASVRHLDLKMSATTLKAAITPASDDVLGTDW